MSLIKIYIKIRSSIIASVTYQITDIFETTMECTFHNAELSQHSNRYSANWSFSTLSLVEQNQNQRV